MSLHHAGPREGVKRSRSNLCHAGALPGVDFLPHLSSHPIAEVDEGTKREDYKAPFFYLDDVQTGITRKMRGVLLDWLMEVAQEYALKRETFHLAVSYVDRYLASLETPLQKTRLQLVGVSALWIACKVEEIYPPRAYDFAVATDGACTTAEIVESERRMVTALRWKLTPTTPYRVVHRLLAAENLSSDTAKWTDAPRETVARRAVSAERLRAAMEVVDLSLLYVDSLCFSPEVLGAAALALTETPAAPDEEDLCVRWLSTVVQPHLVPSNTSRHPREAHISRDAPVEDRETTFQRHNRFALEHFKRSPCASSRAVHELAFSHMQRVVTASSVASTPKTAAKRSPSRGGEVAEVIPPFF